MKALQPLPLAPATGSPLGDGSREATGDRKSELLEPNARTLGWVRDLLQVGLIKLVKTITTGKNLSSELTFQIPRPPWLTLTGVCGTHTAPKWRLESSVLALSACLLGRQDCWAVHFHAGLLT